MDKRRINGVRCAPLARRGRGFDIISPTYGRILLERQARRYLKMSGTEFKTQYQAGKTADPHRSEVIRVAMLRPFTD